MWEGREGTHTLLVGMKVIVAIMEIQNLKIEPPSNLELPTCFAQEIKASKLQIFEHP